MWKKEKSAIDIAFVFNAVLTINLTDSRPVTLQFKIGSRDLFKVVNIKDPNSTVNCMFKVNIENSRFNEFKVYNKVSRTKQWQRCIQSPVKQCRHPPVRWRFCRNSELLTVFRKRSIFDIREGFEYTFSWCHYRFLTYWAYQSVFIVNFE